VRPLEAQVFEIIQTWNPVPKKAKIKMKAAERAKNAILEYPEHALLSIKLSQMLTPTQGYIILIASETRAYHILFRSENG